MPLFAGLLLTICNALVSVLARFVSIEAAIKLAAYIAWIAILGALLTTVYVCISGLNGMLSTSGGAGSTGWVHYFFMGLGMLIPANAGGVMSCIASVWLATNIFRVQSFAIKTFHGGGALTTT